MVKKQRVGYQEGFKYGHSYIDFLREDVLRGSNYSDTLESLKSSFTIFVINHMVKFSDKESADYRLGYIDGLSKAMLEVLVQLAEQEGNDVQDLWFGDLLPIVSNW